jgi:hypothetical protein
MQVSRASAITRVLAALVAAAVVCGCAASAPSASVDASAGPQNKSVSVPSPQRVIEDFPITCPESGELDAEAIDVEFGYELPSGGPFDLNIDYGDGKAYAGTSEKPLAVFSHSYVDPGVYTVQVSVNGGDAFRAEGRCRFAWSRPHPLPEVGSCYATFSMPDMTQAIAKPCGLEAPWVVEAIEESEYGCGVLKVALGGGRSGFACFGLHPSAGSAGSGSYGGGSGYTVVCRDGWVSQSGGRPGACSHHGGVG